MDNVRFFLVLAVSFIGLLLYQKWQQDYPSVTKQSNLQHSQQAPNVATSNPDIPSIQESFDFEPSNQQSNESSIAKEISAKTDLFAMTFSLEGAGINNVGLLKYPVDQKNPDKAVQLLAENTDRMFVYQSGLAGNTTLPTHYDPYTVRKETFNLEEDVDELIVPFKWMSENGVMVNKEYVLTRGSYLIKSRYVVTNNSSEQIKLHQYDQLKRRKPSR